MKKYLSVFSLIAVGILTILFSSCSKNDDSQYELYGRSILGTIVEKESEDATLGKYLFLADDGAEYFVLNSFKIDGKEPEVGTRLLVNFGVVDDLGKSVTNINKKRYSVDLHNYYKILCKDPLVRSEVDDSRFGDGKLIMEVEEGEEDPKDEALGDDRIVSINGRVIDYCNEYLTIDFSAMFGNKDIKHFINLVYWDTDEPVGVIKDERNPAKSDDKVMKLLLTHNAFQDYGYTQADALVSFRIKDMMSKYKQENVIAEGETVSLHIYYYTEKGVVVETPVKLQFKYGSGQDGRYNRNTTENKDFIF